MRNEHLPAEDKNNLTTICRQAMRADELIRQILDFSRSSDMELQPIDIAPQIDELTRMLERTVPENITLNLEYQHDRYMINGDATRILQTLMNLSLNARDAMPNGGVLRIKLARVSTLEIPHTFLRKRPVQEWVVISVSDTGTGIPGDVLPHIFEPFFTTKGPGKGTGLGLAQVYGIVQQHAGHIEVSSHQNAGTVFTIYLPAIPMNSEKGKLLPYSTLNLADGNRETILVVEDNPELRSAMADSLALLNYTVLQAGTGREALSLYEHSEAPISLVITDLVMPEMGGLDLCTELRQRGSRVQIVVLTGYSSDDTMNKLKTLDITESLQKPVEMNKLSHLVSGIISNVPVSP